MKKVVVSLVLATALFGLNSCKKCSTCTYEDPERGTLTSEDVCQKGKAYKHTIEQYENNGWSCKSK